MKRGVFGCEGRTILYIQNHTIRVGGGLLILRTSENGALVFDTQYR